MLELKRRITPVSSAISSQNFPPEFRIKKAKSSHDREGAYGLQATSENQPKSERLAQDSKYKQTPAGSMY